MSHTSRRSIARGVGVVLLALSSPVHAQVSCRPNIFGGQDYQLSDGQRIESRPNIFKGEDYRLPDGRQVTCRRNIFGGQDCP
jgi:hypothetical protein